MLSLAACDRGPEKPESKRESVLEGAGERLSTALPAARTLSETPTGDPKTPPTIDDNMGRAFQGTAQIEIQRGQSVSTLRYISSGDRARVQLERPGQPQLDVLVHGDTMSMLDHETRSVITRDLDDIDASPEADARMEVQRTSRREKCAGRVCEAWTLQTHSSTIDVCVGSFPGDFDTGKFEAFTGVNIPHWVEQLISDGHVPLAAKARPRRLGVSDEEYFLKLIQYSPENVAEELLELPAGYTSRSANSRPPSTPGTLRRR